MTSSAFRRFGVVCASHPWQVIFSTLGAVFFGVSGVSIYVPTPEGFFCKKTALGEQPGLSAPYEPGESDTATVNYHES